MESNCIGVSIITIYSTYRNERVNFQMADQGVSIQFANSFIVVVRLYTSSRYVQSIHQSKTLHQRPPRDAKVTSNRYHKWITMDNDRPLRGPNQARVTTPVS
ncbi:hypothetical protein J6590_084411 [Homalodisca vitripennis]|nr:hypothetical protein J6590_084411 [Homalodisca vitripennis]